MSECADDRTIPAAPDPKGIAAGDETALANLAALMVVEWFERWRMATTDNERGRASQELRLWMAERRAIDAHEGSTKLAELERYLRRIEVVEAQIRGDRPAKQTPPQGQGALGRLQ